MWVEAGEREGEGLREKELVHFNRPNLHGVRHPFET